LKKLSFLTQVATYACAGLTNPAQCSDLPIRTELAEAIFSMGGNLGWLLMKNSQGSGDTR